MSGNFVDISHKFHKEDMFTSYHNMPNHISTVTPLLWGLVGEWYFGKQIKTSKKHWPSQVRSGISLDFDLDKKNSKQQTTTGTLPETNIAPEKWTPGKGESYWKPSCLGAMLNFGKVTLFRCEIKSKPPKSKSCLWTISSRFNTRLVGNEGMNPQYTNVKVDSLIPY